MKKIDLFELYQLFLSTINDRQNGLVRPGRNFQVWVNEISKELFNEFVVLWEKNQVMDDRLGQAFLKTVNIPVLPVAGQNYGKVSYPLDYGGFSSARLIIDGTRTKGLKDVPVLDCETRKVVPFKDADDLAFEAIEEGKNFVEININKVDNQRWGSALVHPIKKVSLGRPVMTQYNEEAGFRIAPKGVSVVVMDYFQMPVDCKFAYTIAADTDALIYDAANSIQLQWTDLAKGEFVTRLKKRYASATKQEHMYSEATAEEK